MHIMHGNDMRYNHRNSYIEKVTHNYQWWWLEASWRNLSPTLLFESGLLMPASPRWLTWRLWALTEAPTCENMNMVRIRPLSFITRMLNKTPSLPPFIICVPPIELLTTTETSLLLVCKVYLWNVCRFQILAQPNKWDGPLETARTERPSLASREAHDPFECAQRAPLTRIHLVPAAFNRRWIVVLWINWRLEIAGFKLLVEGAILSSHGSLKEEFRGPWWMLELAEADHHYLNSGLFKSFVFHQHAG